jgi:nicotinamidase-related amidase
MPVGLLLIDIQNDYFPGGKYELHNSEHAAQAASRLVNYFRQKKLPIIHVQHLSTQPGATFFLPQTPGAEIHSAVTPLASETVIKKHFPNGFRETELLDTLKKQNLSQLVIGGMMTHMCVDATTRAAADFGFECRIAEDGCATRDINLNEKVIPAADVHTAFLAALNWGYGRVLSANAILEEMQKETRK